MSSIKERADAEAAIAENEYPDAEEEAEEESLEPEPEPEPETLAEPSTETAVADLTKKLDSESKRHETALQKIHGEEWAAFGICPCCEGDGFMLPRPPGSLPDIQWEAIRFVSGQNITPDLQMTSRYYVCPECDGYGEVLSGSKAEIHRVKACDNCIGLGYKVKVRDNPAAAAYSVPTSAPAAPVFVGDPSQPKDDWGRPAGHARYGINPEHLGGQW